MIDELPHVLCSFSYFDHDVTLFFGLCVLVSVLRLVSRRWTMHRRMALTMSRNSSRFGFHQKRIDVIRIRWETIACVFQYQVCDLLYQCNHFAFVCSSRPFRFSDDVHIHAVLFRFEFDRGFPSAAGARVNARQCQISRATEASEVDAGEFSSMNSASATSYPACSFHVMEKCKIVFCDCVCLRGLRWSSPDSSCRVSTIVT